MDRIETLANWLRQYESVLCMDVSFDWIDENDYYGWDLTGPHRLLQIFFLGSSDYFPAIWVGESDASEFDRLPVYWFDLSCSDTEDNHSVGNLKTFLTSVLEAKGIPTDALAELSDECVFKGPFGLVPQDDGVVRPRGDCQKSKNGREEN